MKFVDREAELSDMGKLLELSKKKAFLIGIFGLRRVGKTALISHFIKQQDSLYFFVNGDKTSPDLLSEYSEELRKSGVLTPLEHIGNWDSFVELLFQRCKGKILVFDEFQNFSSVEPSVFSVFQKFFDKNENTPIMIIFLGSLIGLFKKIFEDKKQPLYGRLKSKIKLKPLRFSEAAEMLNELGYKETTDIVPFYSVFGGFPKYYVSVEDYGLNKKPLLDVIESLFLLERAPLKAEVEDILKQEFGKRKSLFYSILYAIASGKTKINEIASAVGMKESSISRHMNDLVQHFEFVKKESTVFNENKKTIYKINHPLIEFWFRYIYKTYSEYAIGQAENIKSFMASDINSFIGRRFEAIASEFLTLQENLPLSPSKIGPWWGHHRVEGIRKEIEIDIVCLDENKKEAMFVECKWSALKEKEALRILEELKEKSKHVEWKRKKEYFCIIAKKINGKEALRKAGYFAYDLEDFDKIMKSKRID
ncbi:MAG: ATP-binding protein [Candidatus Aenigmarchaeota archaeon]|nr:ATP-binding protein [Candidatus Aenigmarchaeota archaeon]